MDWRKRSSKQIDNSVSDGDLTGGYEFFPWLWYMRKFYVLAFFLNIFMGYQATKGYFEYEETIALIAGLFFGLAVPSIIAYLLVREHKEKKKGISR